MRKAVLENFRVEGLGLGQVVHCVGMKYLYRVWGYVIHREIQAPTVRKEGFSEMAP